jgi:N-acetylglutamate synthase-like GNAT family acetyltransferase
MSDIEIRKANINDLPVIQDLNNQLFKIEKENYDETLVEGWPLTIEGKEYFLDLINNHYVIVAVLKNEIVAYLAGTINEKGTYEEIKYGEINNMFVKDYFRGQGIGKELINNFKKYCKENEVNNLKVIASYKNKSAVEFYKNNGFEEFNLELTSNI